MWEPHAMVWCINHLAFSSLRSSRTLSANRWSRAASVITWRLMRQSSQMSQSFMFEGTWSDAMDSHWASLARSSHPFFLVSSNDMMGFQCLFSCQCSECNDFRWMPFSMQGVASCGKGLGLEDERSSLVCHLFRLLDETPAAQLSFGSSRCDHRNTHTHMLTRIHKCTGCNFESQGISPSWRMFQRCFLRSSGLSSTLSWRSSYSCSWHEFYHFISLLFISWHEFCGFNFVVVCCC